MRANDQAQRRVDILQTLGLLGPSNGAAIAQRAGYDHTETVAALCQLATSGDVVRIGVGKGTTWRLP